MKLVLPLLFFLSVSCFAAINDTHNVKVAQISVWGSSGDLLIQTNPRHSLTGLNCQSDYWLKIFKDDAGYQSMLSMLLAAQMAGKSITVRAVDDSGTDFCRLERVITYQ